MSEDTETPQSRLRQEWEAMAPSWIEDMRQGENLPRRGLLDPWMLRACGDVSGLRVLDSGCGEGRFSRMLSERGAAFVLGLDTSEAMIDAARQAGGRQIEYQRADVQHMPQLASESFDLAVSYLNQCDLPDFEANTREIYRLLVPGGRFLIANLHPMRCATGLWHRDGQGRKLHVLLDRYCEEGSRTWTILGNQITNFHRTLSTYLNAFLSVGFQLERLDEPVADADMLERFPGLAEEERAPNFIIYQLRKPA
jgi:SAM-dependent methyltransferase